MSFNRSLLTQITKDLADKKKPAMPKAGAQQKIGESNPYYIDKSDIAGKGAFAKQFIPKGSPINMLHQINQPGLDYDFTQLGRAYNHSEDPNTINRLVGNKRFMVANQDIFPGQELTGDYRMQPDLEQPQEDWKMKNGGEMIKRADGSYSKRGLWDNIRANKGSGKKPTKQMLEQERRIKAKMQGGGSTADPGYKTAILNAKNFVKNWNNSPMGQEMLGNSVDRDDPYGFNFMHADAMTNARNQYVDKADVNIISRKQLLDQLNSQRNNKDNSGVAGYASPYAGDWTKITANKNLIDQDPFNQYNLGDKNYKRYALARGVIADPTEVFVHNGAVDHNIYDTLVHELSHVDDHGGVFMPKSDINKILFYSKGKTKDSFNRYVAKPTETRARLMTFRQRAREQGIYDPFTEKINLEQLRKYNVGRDGYDPLDQLRGVYSDKQILDMLNTISYNEKDSNPEEAQARYGGESDNVKKFMDVYHMKYGGGTPAFKEGGQTRDEREMVNGIADILSKVKDRDNRGEIAQEMIQDFEDEGITYNVKKFMDHINLKYGGTPYTHLQGGGSSPSVLSRFPIGNAGVAENDATRVKPGANGFTPADIARLEIEKEVARRKTYLNPQGKSATPAMRQAAEDRIAQEKTNKFTRKIAEAAQTLGAGLEMAAPFTGFAAPAVGAVGAGLGMGSSAYLAGKDLAAGNYGSAALNAGFGAIDAAGLMAIRNPKVKDLIEGADKIGDYSQVVDMTGVASSLDNPLFQNSLGINWAKWNKEIPLNASLMKEYRAIEEAARKNGSWMKNVDGSEFRGTPEQFIQFQSKNFKKAFPKGHTRIYRGANKHVNDFVNVDRPDWALFGSDDINVAKGYANNTEGPVNFYGSNSPVEGWDGHHKGLYELGFPADAKTIEGSADGRSFILLNYDDKVAAGARNKNMARLHNEMLLNDFNNGNPYKLTPDIYDPTKKYLETDTYASYVKNKDNPETVARMSDVIDGGRHPSTIYTIDAERTPMKSLRGNNGMFDMSNPNIYKSLFPFLGAGFAASQFADPKRYGGWSGRYQEGGEQIYNDVDSTDKAFLASMDKYKTITPGDVNSVRNNMAKYIGSPLYSQRQANFPENYLGDKGGYQKKKFEDAIARQKAQQRISNIQKTPYHIAGTNQVDGNQFNHRTNSVELNPSFSLQGIGHEYGHVANNSMMTNFNGIKNYRPESDYVNGRYWDSITDKTKRPAFSTGLNQKEVSQFVGLARPLAPNSMFGNNDPHEDKTSDSGMFADESYGDLMGVRQLLHQKGYTKNFGDNIDQQLIDKAMKDKDISNDFIFKRMYNKYGSDNMIKLNNTIAYNNARPGMAMAQDGGEMEEPYVEEAAPVEVPAQDPTEYTGSSIVDYLTTLGFESSKGFRKQLAKDMGIQGYNFSAAKNLELLNALREAKGLPIGYEESFAPVSAKEMMALEQQRGAYVPMPGVRPMPQQAPVQQRQVEGEAEMNVPVPVPVRRSAPAPVIPQRSQPAPVPNMSPFNPAFGFYGPRNPTKFVPQPKAPARPAPTTGSQGKLMMAKQPVNFPGMFNQVEALKKIKASKPNTPKQVKQVPVDMSTPMGRAAASALSGLLGAKQQAGKYIDSVSDQAADLLEQASYAPEWAVRQYEKYLMPESKAKSASIGVPIPVVKKPNKPYSLTGDQVRVGSDTLDVGTLPRSSDHYFTNSAIVDLNKVNTGFRNRKDYTQIPNLEGNVLNAWMSPSEMSDNQMYLGIDKGGKMITGKKAEMKNAVTVSPVPYTQTSEIGSDYVANQHYKFPSLRGANGSQQSFLNISLGNDGSPDANDRFGGGATIIETPDKKHRYLVRGSVNQVRKAFNDLKKNTGHKVLNIYTLDNGSYNTGLKTADGISTPAELKAYERKNEAGSHGFYFKKYGGSSWLDKYDEGGTTDGILDSVLDPVVNAGKTAFNYVADLFEDPKPVAAPVKKVTLPKSNMTTYGKMAAIYDSANNLKGDGSISDAQKYYNTDKNRIKLSTGRFTGANVSARLIDDIAASAKKSNIPFGQLLALVGRESTFGEQKGINAGADMYLDDYTSGWNVLEDYTPYALDRFLADRKVPGITTTKSSRGYGYEIKDEKAMNSFLERNPQLLEQYKQKLAKTPAIGNRNYLDLSAEYLKKKGIQGYNPGDPRYVQMFNQDYNTLKKDKALMLYLKQKGYKY